MVVQAKNLTPKESALIQKKHSAGPHSRSSRNRHEGPGPAEEGEGSWIFSYADLITILMMFFILMLSISNVSPDKFNALKEALSTEEKPHKKPIANSEQRQEKQTLMIADIALEELARKASSTSADRSTRILAGAKILLEALDSEKLKAAKETYAEFEKIKTALEKSEKAIQNSELFISGDTRRLSLQFPTSAFFAPIQKPWDTITLLPKGREFAATVFESLKNIETSPTIEIESHTSPRLQNKKIITREEAYYLTSQRAIVLFDLFENLGVEDSNIAVQGYGYSRPISPETDRFGRAQRIAESLNDRIVIHLIRKPEEAVQQK